VRVIAPYEFSIDKDVRDYGHLLPVELIAGPINRHDRRVSEALRKALRNRPRLWRIDGVGGDVENLVSGKEAERGSMANGMASGGLPGILGHEYRAATPPGQLCEFLTQRGLPCGNPANYFVDGKWSCSRDHRAWKMT
jgi:hypothetical protein